MLRAVFGKKKQGFSTIELIVVMSIFLLTSATVLPFLGSFHETEDMGTLVQEIEDTLLRAQRRAMTGERNTDWGVRFLGSSFVLFSGDTYSSRNTAFDEVHDVTAAHTLSGSGEIVFTHLTGRPNAAGSVVVSRETISQQASVTVNALGGITRTLP